MRFTITVRNDQLSSMIDELPKRAHTLVMETARDLQQEMSARTPHGRLRKSLRRRTARARKTGSQRAEISGAWWWYFTNYGTRRQGADGFATKAAESQRAKFEKAARKLFEP